MICLTLKSRRYSITQEVFWQQIYPIADRSWLKVTGSTIYAPTLTALQLLREQMHSRINTPFISPL